MSGWICICDGCGFICAWGIDPHLTEGDRLFGCPACHPTNMRPRAFKHGWMVATVPFPKPPYAQVERIRRWAGYA